MAQLRCTLFLDARTLESNINRCASLLIAQNGIWGTKSDEKLQCNNFNILPSDITLFRKQSTKVLFCHNYCAVMCTTTNPLSISDYWSTENSCSGKSKSSYSSLFTTSVPFCSTKGDHFHFTCGQVPVWLYYIVIIYIIFSGSCSVLQFFCDFRPK